MSLVDFGSCPSLSPLLWVWGAGNAPVAGAGAEVSGEGRGGKALPLNSTGASEGLEHRGDVGLNRILPPDAACQVEKRLWLGQRGPRREVGAQGGPRLGGGRGPARGLHLGKVNRQDVQMNWMRGRERDNHMQLRKVGHELVRNLLWAVSHHGGLCAVTAPVWHGGTHRRGFLVLVSRWWRACLQEARSRWLAHRGRPAGPQATANCPLARGQESRAGPGPQPGVSGGCFSLETNMRDRKQRLVCFSGRKSSPL